jgi:hypothetical protein
MATSYITLHWRQIFHDRLCNSLCPGHPSSAILSIWRMSTFLVEESSLSQLCSEVDYFTFAVMQQSWQHHPITHLMVLCSTSPSVTGMSWISQPPDLRMCTYSNFGSDLICMCHIHFLISVPPWCLINSTFDPQLVWHMRSKTPACTYYQCFVVLMGHLFNIKLIVP